MTSYPKITRENFDAVLFDLDGVLTSTAKLHAAAWKQTFDTFLKGYAEKRKETFIPFDIGEDTAYTSMVSLGSTESRVFSHPAELTCLMERLPISPLLKLFAESGTRRTNW